MEALQLLSRQPHRAREAISLILVLLADDRQVDIARYVGSGAFSENVSSPAALAAEILAKLGRWSVLPLRLRLDDPNPVVRQYAIRSLGIMARPEHAEWLLSALTDPVPAVSGEAYTALLKQDAQVYVKLIDKLDTDNMPLQQRHLLIQLLGNSQSVDALPALFKFAGDSNPVLRSESLAALAKFPGANLQTIVLQGIRDGNMQVKINALLLAPRNKNAKVLTAAFAQLSIKDDRLSQTLMKILPLLTGEKPRSIKAWQQWWQAHPARH